MIDLHSHILPGLDDGAQSMEESLEMARIAERDGIEKIVATPHLFRESFIYEDLGIIEIKRSELSQALKENNIRLEILAGAEVHISHNPRVRIEGLGQIMPLGAEIKIFA